MTTCDHTKTRKTIGFLFQRFPAITIGAILGLSLLAATASAATVFVRLEGPVLTVDPLLAGLFSTSDRMQFDFRYESTEVDPNPDPNQGFYFDVTDLFTVSVLGSFTISELQETIFITNDDLSAGGQDRFRLVRNFFPTGPVFSGFEFIELSALLFDDDGTVFSSDKLPTSYGAPSDYEVNFLSIRWKDASGAQGRITGAVDTIIAQSGVIPIPAALPLLLSALAGLGVVGWRRRKAAS